MSGLVGVCRMSWNRMRDTPDATCSVTLSAYSLRHAVYGQGPRVRWPPEGRFGGTFVPARYRTSPNHSELTMPRCVRGVAVAGGARWYWGGQHMSEVERRLEQDLVEPSGKARELEKESRSRLRSQRWVLVATAISLGFVLVVGALVYDADKVSTITWDRLQEIFEPVIGFVAAAGGFGAGVAASRPAQERVESLEERNRRLESELEKIKRLTPEHHA